MIRSQRSSFRVAGYVRVGSVAWFSIESSSRRIAIVCCVIGAVLILLVLFVIGPIAIFFGGGIWSALMGFLTTEDVDERVAAGDAQESASA